MSLVTLPGVLKLCAGIYLLLIFIEWWKCRSSKRFLLELLPLLILVLLDVLIASSNAGYVTFGPDGSSPWVILIMFGAITLGIAAQYIFYLRSGSFSWLEFAKPLCISPILLLPLIASLQSVKNLESMQIVSFALLAFQNGFFWQAVLQQARPKEAGSKSNPTP